LALVNIVVNARDAMPEGGEIRLAARNVAMTGTTAAGKSPVNGLRDVFATGETGGDFAAEELEGDFVALSVHDSGTGIPPDLLSKIVEPFFTTKSASKGTGLGLSQVYGFARQSGGSLMVESEVGVGTVVTLYLPRSHAVPAQRDAAPDALMGTRRGRILAVEDNADVMEATAGLSRISVIP
jgi:two-component system NtrC family sensor kinase